LDIVQKDEMSVAETKRDLPARLRWSGFTLMELLVVIAVLGILAALLLPVLSKAKQTAYATYCLNNSKQLMTALHMYADDFNDWLPPNPEDGSANVWVYGYMTNPDDATNTLYLTDPKYAKLAPYTGSSPGIYKCPADKSGHVRTFSMSQAVGTKPDPPPAAVDGPWLDGNRTHAGDVWQTYGRFSSMNTPGPSALWIFIDENAISVNDAAFAVSMETPTEWVDWPGIYHNFGCSIAYADSHSETHHWMDSRTKADTGDYGPTEQDNNPDIVWLQQRTSAKASAASP
jgi:prepilin-type N-terminal cleavage/methylation domain-containing protein